MLHNFKYVIEAPTCSVKSKRKIPVYNIKIRVRLLFLSSCVVSFGAQFMTFIVCIPHQKRY